MSQFKKLYNTKRWKLRRKEQLTSEPLCAKHLEKGEVVQAVIADHVEPHRGDEEKFFNGRLQSLCKHCHDSYKQRLEKSGTIVGCDEHGLPVDPGHHWNQGRGG